MRQPYRCEARLLVLSGATGKCGVARAAHDGLGSAEEDAAAAAREVAADAVGGGGGEEAANGAMSAKASTTSSVASSSMRGEWCSHAIGDRLPFLVCGATRWVYIT